MKKTFVFALLLIIISVSAAHAAKPGERAMKVFYQTLNPAKHNVFLKYKGMMETGQGKEESVVTIAMKGALTYTETKSEQQHTGAIFDGKTQTTTVIMHKEKMYMKMKAQPAGVPKIGPSEGETEEAERDKLTIEAGQEEINGKKYDFDRLVTKSGNASTYYFTEGTDEWKYWEFGGVRYEVLEYGTSVDDSLFKIPAGYQEMKMP